MLYKIYSKDEKIAYSKKFSKSQRESYRAGKRLGFLQGIHKESKKKETIMHHTYSNDELNSLFDDLDTVQLCKK